MSTPHGTHHPIRRRQTITGEAIDSARQNLDTFVVDQAKRLSVREGFCWRPSEMAPSSFEQVLGEHRSCQRSGLPYRVSPRYCDDIIFTRPDVNHAMRFWHHMEHVKLGLSFSADDEMELGVYHLQALMAAGFEPKSCEYRLLHADTVGQTLCMVELGHFPVRQMRFATTAYFHGINRAIAEEAELPAGGPVSELGGDAA